MRYKIDVLTGDKKNEWDTYVRNSPNANFFHLSGWKNVLAGTYGYKPYYIYAEENKQIRGILPLFIMKNLSFKKIAVSVPFGVYGGICADNDTAGKLLLDKAKQITKEENAQYLELKNTADNGNGLLTKDLYVTFIKELPEDKTMCLKDQPRKTRAASRKAIDSGLKEEIGIHLLKECYDIYAVSVRNLGSPVVPFGFFKRIADEFKDMTTVLSVKLGKKTIASVLVFLYKDTVMPYYGGSLSGFSRFQPNNFMYLRLMEHGVDLGYRFFDFGRSKKETGSYKFKVLQGFSPTPLYYQYFLNTAKEIPNVSPANPKYSIAIEIWKKTPLFLTKIAGPALVKHIGG